jgi:nucleotide-binding universal stress UspA family protein
MTVSPDIPSRQRPVLLCFDGSEDASDAIAQAGALLGSRSAVVESVWEPVRVWAAYDPATIISAPLARLASEELGLDKIAEDVAREKTERGVGLARTAGFDAQGRVARGKTWRAICDVADELDAAVIVLGARGLSRVQSALLGSVSAAVTVHAGRPVLIVSRGTSPDHLTGARR